MSGPNTITLTLRITRDLIDRCGPPGSGHAGPLRRAMAAALPGCDPCAAGLAWLGFFDRGSYWHTETPREVARWLARYVDAGEAEPAVFEVAFRRSGGS